MMKNQNYFFAVDLGATSGRTILGLVTDTSIKLEELNRFSNPIVPENGHFFWDLDHLFHSILAGLSIVAKKEIQLTSIGIDTWGVDFVCLDKNGKILQSPHSYRDPHTQGMQDKFFELMPKDEVYHTTGIQFMDFNSLFQLTALHLNNPELMAQTDKILFMPDALSYLLTGEKVTEYTIASTSQLLDANARLMDEKLLSKLNLTSQIFPDIVYPGEKIGNLKTDIQTQTGLTNVPVIAVAGHDTASAVAAVPALSSSFAYLSSGTWSLMGIETANPIINQASFEENFTNEGGVDGTIRFLKNICGMWLLERCRLEWGPELEENSYPNLIADALKVEAFKAFINPDNAAFANPDSMTEAIQNYCKQTNQFVPQSKAEITRLIFESLAMRYRQVFDKLQHFAAFKIESLHVIGGGSKNDMLNQFTANSLGIVVQAGPMEATAIGNIMLQAKAAGLYENIGQMRKNIANSIELKEYTPVDTNLWESNYNKYLKVYT